MPEITSPLHSIELTPEHQETWDALVYAVTHQRIPQALLFTGPVQLPMLSLAYRLMAFCLCVSEQKPCGHCRECSMVMRGMHPDICEIIPETPHAAIKIEPIRELQTTVFESPQRGERRFVVIYPADALTRQAVNALLKVVEEPPTHLTFIFIAEHLERLPATLVSRCQRTIFEAPPNLHNDPSDYMMFGCIYPENTTRHRLFENKEQWFAHFDLLLRGQADLYTFANLWEPYNLEDILWFFYLWTATLIRYVLKIDESHPSWVLQTGCCLSPAMREPERLFSQLALIQAYQFKAQQISTLNKILVIEMLMMEMI